MTRLPYDCSGGRHSESTALAGLLAHAGVRHPASGEPLSEPLCFGIAGGIGAGYSFCPSIPRTSAGSGVSIIGRHKAYATNAAWYQGCFDRLGVKTRITETSGAGKAFQNLSHELAEGRPAVVWCSKTALPSLHELYGSCGYYMHSLVLFGIDPDKRVAYAADASPGPVTITLDDLAAARSGICSHKNRTLSIERPKPLTTATLRSAVLAGIRASLDELYLKPQMKMFSLAGLETLAATIANGKSKDGWLKVFRPGQLYLALRDCYQSIETDGTGGGLFRTMYADFLEEAAVTTGRGQLKDMASVYRELAAQWTTFAESLLPAKVRPLKETRQLLVKKHELFHTKGPKADKQMAEIVVKLRAISAAMEDDFPLGPNESLEMLTGLREQHLPQHASEKQAAGELLKAAG